MRLRHKFSPDTKPSSLRLNSLLGDPGMRWSRQLRKPQLRQDAISLALLFYKAIAVVNKDGIETAERGAPDRWPGVPVVRAGQQIVDIQV